MRTFKILIPVLTLILVSFLGNEVRSESLRKQPLKSVSEHSIAKQEVSPVDDKNSDELQKQYFDKLWHINMAIKDEHFNQRMLSIQNKSHHKKVMLELNYRGRIPHDVEMEGQELKDRDMRTKEKINNLEREKENLKLDVLKYYNGKMPKWLLGRWQEEESRYNKYMENYIQEMKEELNKEKE